MPQHSPNSRRKLAQAGFLLLAILLLSTSAVALPIFEYQQNLKRAIAALEPLDYVEEGEDPNLYGSQFNEAVATVRSVLPASQTVELDGDVVNVDNSWIHKALDDINQTVDNRQKIIDLLESLRAMETRIAERQNPTHLVDSKAQAKSKLETILARPEYSGNAKGTNAFSRLLQDFLRWLQKFFPKRREVDEGRASLISMIARILVVGAALFLLGYVAKILLARFRRTRKQKPSKKKEPRIVLGERLAPDETAKDLLSDAEALARAGDLRAAIRKAYIALLVELGDRKLLSLAQHKTNRDYLNALRSAPQLHSRVRGLTDSFERHWYGLAQATPNDWQDFRAGYHATLQAGS